MAKFKSPLNDPTVYVDQQEVADIRSQSRIIWRPDSQPLWPVKNITFTDNDKSLRRRLIKALMSTSATDELQILGYRIFKCSPSYPCKSPLCNYCRTKIQDRYQRRVLKYFKTAKKKNIFWVTILDDLTYSPVTDVPKRSVSLKRKIKGAFQKSPIIRHAKVFAAFELDVKKPSQIEENEEAIDLLTEYGLLDNDEAAFMPHYHAIVAVDDMVDKAQLAGELRKILLKSKQVSVGRLHIDKTKEDNLKTLARYMFKFRYQFADNILKDKPSYGNRFDDDTLRLYAQSVHSIIGKRGLVQYDLSYNL